MFADRTTKKYYIEPTALTICSFIAAFALTLAADNKFVGRSGGLISLIAVFVVSSFVYPAIGLALGRLNFNLWSWALGPTHEKDEDGGFIVFLCGATCLWPVVVPPAVLCGVIYGLIRRMSE